VIGLGAPALNLLKVTGNSGVRSVGVKRGPATSMLPDRAGRAVEVVSSTPKIMAPIRELRNYVNAATRATAELLEAILCAFLLARLRRHPIPIWRGPGQGGGEVEKIHVPALREPPEQIPVVFDAGDRLAPCVIRLSVDTAYRLVWITFNLAALVAFSPFTKGSGCDRRNNPSIHPSFDPGQGGVPVSAMTYKTTKAGGPVNTRRTIMELVERVLNEAVRAAERQGLAAFCGPEVVPGLVRVAGGEELVAEAERALDRLADVRAGLPLVQFVVVSPIPRSKVLRPGQVLVHDPITLAVVVASAAAHRLARYLMECDMGLLPFLLEGRPAGLPPLSLAERAERHLARLVEDVHPAVREVMMPRLHTAAAELARLDEAASQRERLRVLLHE